MKHLLYLSLFIAALSFGHWVVAPWWETENAERSLASDSRAIQNAGEFLNTLKQWGEGAELDLPCLKDIFAKESPTEAKQRVKNTVVNNLTRLWIEENSFHPVSADQYANCEKNCSCSLILTYMSETDIRSKKTSLDPAHVKELEDKSRNPSSVRGMQCAMDYQKKFCEQEELLEDLAEVATR